MTGKPAEAPYAQPLLGVSLLVGGREAEILFAGAAPGLVGVLQVNARLPQPADPPPSTSPQAYSLLLRVGEQSMRQRNVILWIK